MKLSIVTMTDYEWYAMDGVRQFGGKLDLLVCMMMSPVAVI
jgi:hypothetical protein